MSTYRKLLTGMILTVPIALFGCGTDTPTPNYGNIDLEHRYGYVSLVDGQMGVVDLETMHVVNKVGLSAHASHMLFTIEGTSDVLYGDWDTNEIVRLHFEGDHSAPPTEVWRIHSPVQMHGFMMVDKFLVVTSRLELTKAVQFEITEIDTSVAIYDTEASEWVSTIETGSPSYGAVGPDGRIYVTNVHHRSVSVIDPATWTVVETLAVGPDSWVTGEGSIGPKGITFSPDGRFMVTADYEGMSLTVFEFTDNGLGSKRVIPVDGVPKAATFTADNSELWVVTYDLNLDKSAITDVDPMGAWYDGPQPAEEARNAERDTSVHIYDARSLEAIESFSGLGLISPRMSPDDANLVYITTSKGSVQAIDRVTHRVVGEAQVGQVGLPVVCGNLTL